MSTSICARTSARSHSTTSISAAEAMKANGTIVSRTLFETSRVYRWPVLNAMLNTAAGATWVSLHHGGGVGIGNSIHAGMVVVADGTDDAARRLDRVLTTDSGLGVVRHADAGYDAAEAFGRARGIDRPAREAT